MKKIAIILIQFILLIPALNAQSVPGIQSVSSFEELNTKRNNLNREIAETEVSLSMIPDTDTAEISIDINSYMLEISSIENRMKGIADPKDTTSRILQRNLDFYKQLLKRSQNDFTQAAIAKKNKIELKKIR